jgi:serine/threonine protein kinase
LLSKVKLCTKLSNGQQAAIKRYNKLTLKKQKQYVRRPSGIGMQIVTQLDSVRKELQILAKLRHPNIVHVDEIIEDDDEIEDASDKIYVVMELALYKEIMTWNEATYQFVPNVVFGSEFIPAEAIVSVLKDLANGLFFLHIEKGIVHRDIKP